MMIKAGIIGSTGYAGGELARLLLREKMWRSNGTVPEATLTRNMHLFIRICLNWWMQSVWMTI